MNLKNLLLIQVVFGVVTLGCYIGNIVRFAKCDFEPSYRAEVLYGIGLALPTFYVTVFMDLEKPDN